METFKVPKGDMKIALIGGGPSLKDQLDDIRKFDGVTVACGSVHDYLIDNHIYPTFCVLCDPDEITSYYISSPNASTIYLVATQ